VTACATRDKGGGQRAGVCAGWRTRRTTGAAVALARIFRATRLLIAPRRGLSFAWLEGG
jgi:hypothetical protein